MTRSFSVRAASCGLVLSLVWAVAVGSDPPIFVDGFESGDTSSWTGAAAGSQPAGFRATDLDFMDPHFFAFVPGLNCIDVTNFSQFGIEGLNPTLQERIQQDAEPDGILDLSFVGVFRPLHQFPGTTTGVELVFPDCDAPLEATSCTLPPGSARTSAIAQSEGNTTCLAPVEGTTSGYAPAIVSSVAPVGGACFAAFLGDVTLSFVLPIPLIDTWVAGEWHGSPATEIRDGLIRGFLTEATANSTIIPEGTTGIGDIDGEPLSSLLRGGAGSCSHPSPAPGDQDIYVDGQSGWYVYLNFEAAHVPYREL